MKKIIVNLTLLLICFTIIFTQPILANDLPDKKVNLQFDNMKLERVFEGLGKVADINILLGSELDEKVDYNLKGVKFSSAINIITRSENLGYIYKENILIIDRLDNMDKYKNDEEIKSKIIQRKKENNSTGNKNKKDNIKPSSAIIVNSESDFNSSILIDQDKKQENNNYRDMKGLNKGTLLPAKLEVGLVSSNKPVPALVKITKNIKYKGKLIIPKGALLTGVGRTDYGVRKIFIDLNKLIIGEREIDIKAHLVKEDGTTGFQSEYRDLSKENFWQRFLLEFAKGIGNTLKSQRDSIRNNIIKKGQNGVDEWTNQLEKEAQRKGEIITVNAGYKGYIFIDEKIPLKYFPEQ